ncbi:hypothetical protein [Allorhodopirellula heiligendammensis]|uniref:Uncharacterized protein n=1 Tax=Allorhodopirellula heiligendammensis TaxID=2714739 RepID=A0A5C6BVC2_9BACT|nr:hypothetical protein [Allorhodopirellula heiligendammensis]TWU16230.1 hypothetical protein Poly21_34350 [Allorhodopirellula heiligendammensis]
MPAPSLRILSRLSIVAAATLVAAAAAPGQSTAPPALFGRDALGRAMPSPADVRPFQSDRYVGIFYFAWMQNIAAYDNSLILQNHPDAMTTNASPPWGKKNAFHFWGEPLFGYYRSDDPWILRRHADLLSDAGVDFLVIDATNGLFYENVITEMLRILADKHAAGEHTPQLTFMVNSHAERTAQRIYEAFYESGEHADFFFAWKGKPLLICDPAKASQEVAEFFTLRKAHWPFELVNTHNAWHWEAIYPQVHSYDQDPTRPEQVSVSVGQNLDQKTGRVEMMSTGRARGRSFHRGSVDPRPNAFQYGLNFEEQWQGALELDPEVTFVTGWNEWIAMQLNTGASGPPVFCDQFDLEASRDVEMMKGGYGDNYYMQLTANIRRFKGMTPERETGPSANRQGKTIEIEGPMSQWDDVESVYVDHLCDTLPRDFPGCGQHHYRVTSGRNDFHIAKVTEDAENLYFYMRTREPITDSHDPNWMWLLLDVATPRVESKATASHWEGFELLIRGDTVTSSTGDWNWQPAGSARFRVDGHHMHVAISKSVLNPYFEHTESGASIGFKWIDNSQSPGDIMDTYTNGDAAPGGRFQYRYQLR